MNKVILIGRLTKDPELRFTSGNGVAVTTFTLAVDRNFSNQQGERIADFIPIVVWRKLAEVCANNLTKGQQIAVSGRIQTRSWDGNDGKKRWTTEVVADEVKFLGKPSSSSSAGTPYISNDDGNEDYYEGFTPIDNEDNLPF
ncbi:MAG: single-stranded DNA-binding protein [Thermoanaerobacteraceae bacterium]|nr:single-stranded DNA-binding protein [Thermoanaerobacteraceae bacterium]